MIYSARVFSDKTRILSCTASRLIVGDYEYLRVIIIKHPEFFKADRFYNYPYRDLSGKIKDIIKRQTFKEHRNIRDNIMKLRKNWLSITNVAYYQKNKAVIDYMAYIYPAHIGLIPEEAITHEMVVYLLEKKLFLTILYIPERLRTKEIAFRFNLHKYPLPLVYRGDHINIMDLFES